MSLIASNEELIHRHIINKNLSPKRFYHHLCSAKFQGDDLSNWTTGELIHAIELFTSQENRIQESEAEGEYDNLAVSCDLTDPDKGSSSFYVVGEEEHQQRDTFELDSENQLEFGAFFRTDNINSYISETKTTTSFIFFKNVVFTVKTEPFNWTVDRLFEDFMCLRAALTRDFPLVVVILQGSAAQQRRLQQFCSRLPLPLSGQKVLHREFPRSGHWEPVFEKLQKSVLFSLPRTKLFSERNQKYRNRHFAGKLISGSRIWKMGSRNLSQLIFSAA